MKYISYIRQMITSVIVFIILIWAFFKNNLFAQIIISPFLICSIAIFFEMLFLIIHKEKIATIFRYIFRLTFLIYALGFLIYAIYYAIINKSYSLLIIATIFTIIISNFVKSFFIKNKK